MTGSREVLEPPDAGNWSRDSYEQDELFAFKCKCTSTCPDVYVGRTKKHFDLNKVRTISDLAKIHKSGIRIRLDPILTIAATKIRSPDLFKKPGKGLELATIVRDINSKELR